MAGGPPRDPGLLGCAGHCPLHGRGMDVMSPELAGPMIPVYGGGEDVLPRGLATGAGKLAAERAR